MTISSDATNAVVGMVPVVVAAGVVDRITRPKERVVYRKAKGKEKAVQKSKRAKKPVMVEMVQGKKDLASFEAEAKAFKVPHVTLKPRSAIKLVKMHDDGDMTVKQGGKLHVVTTDHKVFRQLTPKQAQKTGLTSIKRGAVYHTPVKGGVMLSRRSLKRGRR